MISAARSSPTTASRARRRPTSPTLRPSEPDEHTLPTLVREGATIGAGAIDRLRPRIGRFALVGMGSVVTRSVPDFHLVVGNPARSIAVRVPLRRAGRCGSRRARRPTSTTTSRARRAAAATRVAAADGDRARRELSSTAMPCSWAVVGGGMLGLDARAPAGAARARRHRLRGGARRSAGSLAWQLGPSTASSLGPALPRHPAVRHAPARRCSPSSGSSDDMRVGRDRRPASTRRPAVLDVEHARVPPLPAAAAARQAAARRHDLLRRRKIRDGRRLERMPVDDWLRRWSGRRTFERSGCRCCGPSSARATGRRRPRSSGRRSSGCTPPGAPGSRRRCSATCPAATPASSSGSREVLARARRRASRSARRVDEVEREPSDGVARPTSTATVDRFDRVVVTAAAPIAARLCPDLDAARARRARRRALPGHRVRVAAAAAAARRRTTSPTSPTRRARSPRSSRCRRSSTRRSSAATRSSTCPKYVDARRPAVRR